MMELFLMSLLPYFIFTAYKSKKSFHILQQNYYDESERYFLWILKNPKKVWLEVDSLFIILFSFLLLPEKMCVLIFVSFYILLFAQYHTKMKLEQTKKPLVVTARVKRMIFTLIILHLMLLFPMIKFYDNNLIVANYLLLSFTTYLNYLIIKLVNFINKPIEKCVFMSYKLKALKKMKMLKIPVVGITGSYGKTSSKNIINDILSVKFNSFATPQNYNTTYGLILTINNHLDKFNDIFIAEMGAFKVGEIKASCDFIKPTHGVLTTIGEAHLESFGSRKNIQKGKFELIESLPSDGIAILNGDDKYQKEYKLKNDCNVYWIGIDNEDVDLSASNIKLSHSGTSFDVRFKDDEEIYTFNTRLLGKHNVYNVLAGILLGKKLGMSVIELKRGVSKIQTIEHRLELKKIGTLNIIDDAYNSNPVGSKAAVEVLGMMPGIKIIVTPGMIELGEEQYELNKKFGTYIAKEVDYAILIGKDQTKPIYEGLIESSFPKEKIFILNDVKEAFPLMRRLEEGETYALLENDLPDLFNE
jgi:UDP-N-acetylmuramyl pentapeptide synthase